MLCVDPKTNREEDEQMQYWQSVTNIICSCGSVPRCNVDYFRSNLSNIYSEAYYDDQVLFTNVTNKNTYMEKILFDIMNLTL